MTTKQRNKERDYHIENEFTRVINCVNPNRRKLMDTTASRAYLTACNAVQNVHELSDEADHLRQEVIRLKMTINLMQKEMDRKLNQMADMYMTHVKMPVVLPGKIPEI